jgi:hypothetical protein
MTTMLHMLPRQDPFDSALQIAQLRNLTSSRAAGAMLAEIYTGGAPVRFDPSPKASPVAFLGAGAQVPAWDDSRSRDGRHGRLPFAINPSEGR